MTAVKSYKIVFKKEWNSYFTSPIAYIVISVFLVVTGWFFFSTFFIYKQANMREFFSLLPVIFSFIVPALTMRLFSEELNSGSLEVLLTVPITLLDAIIGKFLASAAFIAVMLSPTLIYVISIAFLGDLEAGPVIGGYIGAVCLGAAFSSIGIFASALTKNQIISFIAALAICFALTIFDKMLVFMPSGIVKFFEYLSSDYHFSNIAKGLIDSRDILYFASLCFIALYGTYLVMKEKD